jgi:hypothetical protein
MAINNDDQERERASEHRKVMAAARSELCRGERCGPRPTKDVRQRTRIGRREVVGDGSELVTRSREPKPPCEKKKPTNAPCCRSLTAK